MTAPQLRAIEPSQALVLQDGSVVHARISTGLLLCAFNEVSRVGGAVLLTAPTERGMRSSLQDLSRKIVTQSRQPADEVRFKVLSVGKTDFGETIAKLFQELGFRLAGTAHESAPIDAYFYSDVGRLRAAPVDRAPVPVSVSAAASVHEQMQKRKTRVLIVDDSKTIRQLLAKILSADPELEVLGAAERPSEAARMIREMKPDVITLDIHMPEMDGVAFLQSYIREFPIPTVMISSISMEESNQVLQALEIGAVDYIQKPSFEKLDKMAPMIAEMVRTAATVKVRSSAGTRVSHTRIEKVSNLNQNLMIAVGASTGGTEALRHFLCKLPSGIPPIVIVQHIPPVFSKAFATRLDATCPFEVKEAEDGDLVQPDRVLIAPGGLQMAVEKGGPTGYRVKVWDGEPVNRHKPSVDVLFRSVADQVGKKSIGIIMTGMGRDGAAGMLQMKNSGSRTIAQDESSCVVFGMPKEAIKLGAAEKIMPLDRIAETLLSWLDVGNRVHSQG